MQKINFSSLKAGKPEGPPKQSFRSSLVGILVFIGFVPLLIVLFILFSMKPAFSSVLIVLAMIGLIIYTSKRNKVFEKQIKQFAADNGWGSDAQTPVIDLFNRKGYKSRPSLVHGSLDGINFWLYLCEPPVFRTDENRNSSAVYMLTFEFPKGMPEMLVVPASGAFKYIADVVFKEDLGLQRINLEGDFGEKIQVYMVPGQQIPVLEYITPDVMDALKGHLQNFITYSGNFLSVSTAQAPLDGKTVKQLFEEGQIIIKEIKEKQHL